ncbi:hypothetical protein FISHEDRAFT_8198, partial [Fistulina hepatica ATCC 64428]
MLVLNPDFERAKLPSAATKLVASLNNICVSTDVLETEETQECDLDARKLAYVCPVKGTEAQTPSATNRSIAQFLARKRARNNASNCAEFLDSSRKMQDGEPSCARVDAKAVDGDSQVKYDIAKNEGGPLRETVHGISNGVDATKAEGGTEKSSHNAPPHTELEERVQNIEAHAAIRYGKQRFLALRPVYQLIRYMGAVPSMPTTLEARIKFLEDHLIKIEREHPPWAALHFYQPDRGWPPPPPL